MKTTTQIFVAVLVTFTLSGCCLFVTCDCINPAIEFEYRRADDSCPDTLIHSVFLVENDSMVFSNIYSPLNSFACGFRLEEIYNYNDYWHLVEIPTDSLRDTIEILEITEHEYRRRLGSCCNCGPGIDSVTVLINGELISGTRYIERSIP